ncbi:MAG: tyrosine-type recombinase/integrase [Eubacteriales bacterium]|nr:tyrosine-type recombinase/integrase [Eubacteriales bacterium]
MEQTMCNEIERYTAFLHESEKADGTIEKYVRDVRSFVSWIGQEALCMEKVIEWKESLVESGYEPVTINSMLSSLNSFFKFIGKATCCVKFLKIQRKLYRSEEKELTKDEYLRLVKAAEDKGNERMVLLLETICATGIRVSEVKYITMEAVERGIAEITLKGKIRTIILPGKLCRKLRKYAGKRRIASGEIFLTGSGKAINRKQIWASMKALCKAANVDSSKVFPHNLRHLFARIFYKVSRDIVKLANVLGHSSIETTRIYLVTTSNEDAKQLDLLGLVS